MNKLILPALFLMLAGTGCTVRVTRQEPTWRPAPPPVATRPLPRPPPPPPARIERMDRREAMAVAIHHARRRGFRDVEVDKVHLTGNDVWKVKLEVERRGAEGKMHVDLDAWTREVIRAQEQVKYRPHRGKDWDDDRKKGKRVGAAHDKATAVAKRG